MNDKPILKPRIKTFAAFIWQERRISISIFLCSMIFPLFSIPLPFMFKKLVDALAYHPKVSGIMNASLWLGIAYLAVKLAEGMREYFTQKYREKTTIRLKNLFFQHFLRIELGYFSKQGSGYFVGRLNEVDNLKDLFVDQLGGAISALTLGLISFVALLYISIPCALIFMAYIPLEIWGVIRVRRQILEKSKTTRESQSRLMEQAQEYIQNVEKIKASSIGRKVFEKFVAGNNMVYDSIMSLTKWRIFFDTTIESVSVPFFIAAFAVLGLSVVAGNRTVGDLIAMNQFGTFFLSSFLHLTAIFQQAIVSLASFNRVFDILEQEPEVKEGTEFLTCRSDDHLPFNMYCDGLYFKYPEQSNYSLNNISFQAQAGERIIIVGESGSGKTTLFKLIARLYDPESGRILIQNRPINNLRFETLRALITYIPQDQFLLKGSIMDNLLLFAESAGESEIKTILKKAGLQSFFESLPQGYGTEIQELGRGLSGGQRQAISLARLFLNRPRIILLDEPTSWQDPHLEHIALESIKNITHECILITISHKPTTILSGNRVLLMHKGEILAEGTHRTLLTNNDIYASYFAQLQS